MDLIDGRIGPLGHDLEQDNRDRVRGSAPTLARSPYGPVGTVPSFLGRPGRRPGGTGLLAAAATSPGSRTPNALLT